MQHTPASPRKANGCRDRNCAGGISEYNEGYAALGDNHCARQLLKQPSAVTERSCYVGVTLLFRQKTPKKQHQPVVRDHDQSSNTAPFLVQGFDFLVVLWTGNMEHAGCCCVSL